MGTLSRLRSYIRSMRLSRALMLAAGVTVLVGGYLVSSSVGATAQSRDKMSVKDMASLTGTVEATRPFKAAQVYIRNVDKRMQYMVYTSAGKFRAVALLPGNYEITAQAKGSSPRFRSW